MKHSAYKGKIEYRIDSPDYPSGIWGFEEFRITKHHDGSRVFRAYCEFNKNPSIIRDVIQRVDKDFHPQDSTVRLTLDDKFYGSTWYNFTDSKAEYQGFTEKDGRISDKVSIDRNIRGFGTHALTGDAWLTARFDLSKGLGIQTFKNNLITSLNHLGATGPAFERTTSSSFKYFGKEKISVQSGDFLCYHFAFVNMSNNHPPYHLWVTEEDFIFVKGSVEESYKWNFELIEFE